MSTQRSHGSRRLAERAGFTGFSGFAGFERFVARLDSDALRSNYLAIQELVPGQSILPMVKAGAYGHGAAWATRALLTLPGIYGFGLATLEEAGELRRELGASGRRARLIVFSGAAPWTEEKGSYCEKYGLTPVIATDEDWFAFLKGGWPVRLGYELKFNTGLNRLGLSQGLAPAVARALRDRPGIEHPNGVFSHLAMSDQPDSKLSRSQREKFAWLRGELAPALPATHFHLGNSGAIWNQKHWDLTALGDVVRPGISLYGIVPWSGAPARGIRPVMTLDAEVIHRHRLKAGESLGYDATFKVDSRTGDGRPVEVAILSAGYADGVSRMLSGRGSVLIRSRRAPILGRVSMDLCAVHCPPETRVGDRAQLLGPGIDAWETARAAETIPYEVLTSISGRVQRIYG